MTAKNDDEPGELVDEIEVRFSDGSFIVRSAAVGVSGRGPTIEQALSNLVEAVEESVSEGFDEELEPSGTS